MLMLQYLYRNLLRSLDGSVTQSQCPVCSRTYMTARHRASGVVLLVAGRRKSKTCFCPFWQLPRQHGSLVRLTLMSLREVSLRGVCSLYLSSARSVLLGLMQETKTPVGLLKNSLRSGRKHETSSNS